MSLPPPAAVRPIRTNLITGFLGAGKTTAIGTLLPQRPPAERWSILVNEYGQVALDQVLLDPGRDDVRVAELAGGCFCCALGQELPYVLAQFIRQTRPDRLLLEPTGSGHPARVVDLLRSPPFRSVIDLRATLCLVDPQDFANPRIAQGPVFHDQIQMADVVVLNWLDRRDTALVRRCRDWIESLDPPKLRIVETTFGQLDAAWLDLEGHPLRAPRFAEAAAEHHAPHPAPGVSAPVELTVSRTPQPGRPLRFPSEGLGQWACGWLFAPADRFDREPLLDYLGQLQPVLRLKGVFHCADDWWFINRSRQDTSLSRSAYRRDSRLEIIVDTPSVDWERIERTLLGCLEGEGRGSGEPPRSAGVA